MTNPALARLIELAETEHLVADAEYRISTDPPCDVCAELAALRDALADEPCPLGDPGCRAEYHK